MRQTIIPFVIIIVQASKGDTSNPFCRECHGNYGAENGPTSFLLAKWTLRLDDRAFAPRISSQVPIILRPLPLRSASHVPLNGVYESAIFTRRTSL